MSGAIDPGARGGPSAGVPAQLWFEVQEFLHREADLLDARQFDAWLGVLDDDVRYRVPLARNVRHDAREREYSAPGEIAWFDEGLDTLRQRVAQLNSGAHWIEEPASRVSHLVTNIRVLDAGPDPARCERVVVRCRFLVYLNRLQGEVSLFVGKRTDTLRRAGDGEWRLLDRVVQLDQNVLQAKALSVML